MENHPDHRSPDLNSQWRRREFLRLAALGFVARYVVLPTDLAVAQNLSSFVDNTDPETVFGLSVASGDPTPTGFVLWTRINPNVVVSQAGLRVQLSLDPSFRTLAFQAEIPASEISGVLDFTVRIDLDGKLLNDRIYYYRFIYRGVRSRTGRARTLPGENFDLTKVKFAVVNCQDYTNGYYPAFQYIATDPTIDFVLHLGDFIYETTGDTSFQNNPFPDRTIQLPSGSSVALNLSDYRTLYQTYRKDPFLRAALENFTWLTIWDDHEMANDQYHDYIHNSGGAPDHPYTTDAQYQANSVALLRQLKYDSQQAWFEYSAARVKYDPAGATIFDRLSIYRTFKFGSLLELFLTDERTYRSPHPEGETEFGERYFAVSNPSQRAATQTMLGTAQRDRFVSGVANSSALWKAWANEVLLSALQVLITPDLLGLLPTKVTGFVTVDNDAWDGYQYERSYIAQAFKKAGLTNLVVLTGDLHSYVAGYYKVDFNQLLNIDPRNLVGVEYMTPAITSSNLQEQLGLNDSVTKLLEDLVELNNPHIKFFNSRSYGYATAEFTRHVCTYTMYAVDKGTNSPSAARTILKEFQTPVNTVRIIDITP